MADIKAFQGFRPRADIVDRVAALPYDVYNREEAKKEVEREPLSFLRIDRAETQFDDSVDTYAPEVPEGKGDSGFHDPGRNVHPGRQAGLLHIRADNGWKSTDRAGCLCVH